MRVITNSPCVDVDLVEDFFTWRIRHYDVWHVAAAFYGDWSTPC